MAENSETPLFNGLSRGCMEYFVHYLEYLGSLIFFVILSVYFKIQQEN